ncbi:hypothetical protein LPJ64_001141 [Coemansia asiatica]|uniref:SWI/SNF and RSC complexes subunit Ssr4 C-terminal domain-containing protein n=1 Tax=Coemansia asiatica TaxID=1052880 RepID=A0A9W7XQL4_9FUNG|nr:hypothetical protein LPJ64_001141 [Coemansia asiatica]
MSGPAVPPQTPIRYPQSQQQFIARPGQPIPLSMVSPNQQQAQQQHIQQQQQQQQQLQRPGMPQFRPNMNATQQQQMFVAGAAGQGAPVNMPQYSNPLQQQHQFIQQQGAIGQPRPIQAIRPGQQMQNQHTLFTGNTNINVAGVIPQVPQPHPALIQPSTPLQNRKRKSKLAQDTAAQASAANASAMADDDSGDEVDRVQPYNISLARYQNNHNMMSEVFVALPTSTIKIPNHYYENIDKETVVKDLKTLGNALEQCEKEHEERIQGIKEDREEFEKVVKAIKEANNDNIDQVKKNLESLFAMEFVNNPYRTVDRIPISEIDSVEGAVYRQL